MRIDLQLKRAGRLEPEGVHLDLAFAEDPGMPPQPYERLLLAAMRRDPTLFPSQELIEETWRIVQPLLDSPPPVTTYPKGTWGPSEADALIERSGGWHDPSSVAPR